MQGTLSLDVVSCSLKRQKACVSGFKLGVFRLLTQKGFLYIVNLWSRFNHSLNGRPGQASSQKFGLWEWKVELKRHPQINGIRIY